MNVIDLGSVKPSDHYLRALIYGQAGAGKTHLLRDFPKPMLYYNFDHKEAPLVGIEDIDCINYTVEEIKKGSITTLNCEAVFNQFWLDWLEGKRDSKYKTLVLDSLTSLDSILLKAKILASGKQIDDKATLPVYGDMKNFYKTLFMSTQSIQGKHVVFIAHEHFKEDEKQGIMHIGPLITGSMSEEISALFNETLHLECRETSPKKLERFLYYQKHRLYTATATAFKGDGVIKNPSFKSIMECIK